MTEPVRIRLPKFALRLLEAEAATEQVELGAVLSQLIMLGVYDLRRRKLEANQRAQAGPSP